MRSDLRFVMELLSHSDDFIETASKAARGLARRCIWSWDELLAVQTCKSVNTKEHQDSGRSEGCAGRSALEIPVEKRALSIAYNYIIDEVVPSLPDRQPTEDIWDQSFTIVDFV